MSLHPARLPGKVQNFGALMDCLEEMHGDGTLRHTGKPNDVRHDNLLRAAWAAEALKTYAELTFGGSLGAEAEDVRTVLGDLLADLMHLCDATKLKWGEEFVDAERCYEFEVEE